MGILAKKFNEFSKQIGNKTSYGGLKQFGNKLSKSLHSGLDDVADISGKVSHVLGKARDVADGLRGVPVVGGMASVVGGGLSQVKNIVDIGQKGVKGLEKAVKHSEAIGNVIDTHHKTIGKAITNGDTSNIVGAVKSVAEIAQKNPFR
jgi:hypothetical protein